MKFILNEKYILDERLILDEGASEDNTKLNALSTEISNCISTLESTVNYINLFNNSAEELRNKKTELDAIPSVNEKKVKVKQVADAVKKSLNKIYNNSWPNQYNDLNTELQKPKDSISLDLIINYISEIYAESSSNIEYINETIGKCKKALAKLENVKANVKKLSKEQETKLTSVYHNLNKNLTSKAGSKGVIYNIKEIKNFNDAKKSCEHINKLLEDNILTNTVIDWNELMQNSTEADLANGGALDNLDNTIDKWYAAVWKGYDTNLIKGLFDTIALEIEAYGWNEYENPFIQFLKYAIKNINTFADAVGKDAIKYSIIHNAVVDNMLSEEDLEQTGVLGKHNIIFNPAFYTKSRYEMEQYLKLQQYAEEYFNKQIKDENSIISKNYKKKSYLSKFLIDLFYNPGNPLDADSNGTFSAANLKDYKEIYAICTKLFGKHFIRRINDKDEDGKLWIRGGRISSAARDIADQAKIDGNGDEAKINNILWRIFRVINVYSQFSKILNDEDKEEIRKKFKLEPDFTKPSPDEIENVTARYFDEYSINSFDKNPQLAIDFIKAVTGKDN